MLFPEIFVKNMLNSFGEFGTLEDRSISNQPVDVYTDDNNLFIEIACVGADKEDITVECTGHVLRISYKKSGDESKSYRYRSVKRSNFDLSYKISDNYDINQTTVSLDKGILKVQVPAVQKVEPEKRVLEIN